MTLTCVRTDAIDTTEAPFVTRRCSAWVQLIAAVYVTASELHASDDVELLGVSEEP